MTRARAGNESSAESKQAVKISALSFLSQRNADSPGAINLIGYISTFLNLFSYLFQLPMGQILFKTSRCFDNGFWKSKELLSHSKLSLLVLSYRCFNVSKRAKHESIFAAFNIHQSAQIKFIIDDSSGV